MPTPVVTESGHARALEETHAWVKPLLRRVPITRLINVTPLDFVGLPVWSAVTPLARDLTVHAGKGRTSLAAQLSAIMEAVERVCSESLPDDRIRKSSFNALESEHELPVLDPETLGLPFDTTFARDRVIRWTIGYDVAQDGHVWVPLDAALSPAEDGVCKGVETNGLAAGNTMTEAVVHALYEVIERNAISIEQFCELYGEPTDPRASPVRILDLALLPEDSRAWIHALSLTKWLFGTGRYQPYIWSLVSGQPELHEVVETVVAADALAETRRDALARVLSRRLADITTFAPELWNELDFVDELDAELMRWHAAGTLASCVSEFEPSVLQRVRDEVAIAHGVNDWTMLCEEVVDDRLFDAIPFAWIEEACLQIARARCWRSRAVRA